MKNFNYSEINWFMQEAVLQAEIGENKGEVPIGAIVLNKDKIVIARSSNKKETTFDPTSHAEIEVIREAAKIIQDWRLTGCSLFVTLEPCAMCLAAMVHARIENLFFGAYDKKAGALSLGYEFQKDKRLNHSFNVMGGINHFEYSKLLSNFFKQKRNPYKDLTQQF
jgi:tRNA(adenine34) deaminase